MLSLLPFMHQKCYTEEVSSPQARVLRGLQGGTSQRTAQSQVFLDSLQDPGFTSVFSTFKVVFRLILLKAISKKLRRQENRTGESSIKLLHLVEQSDSHLCWCNGIFIIWRRALKLAYELFYYSFGKKWASALFIHLILSWNKACGLWLAALSNRKYHTVTFHRSVSASRARTPQGTVCVHLAFGTEWSWPGLPPPSRAQSCLTCPACSAWNPRGRWIPHREDMETRTEEPGTL